MVILDVIVIWDERAQVFFFIPTRKRDFTYKNDISSSYDCNFLLHSIFRGTESDSSVKLFKKIVFYQKNSRYLIGQQRTVEQSYRSSH